MVLSAAVDGAARGNPGPAGAGVWLGDGKGRTIGEHSVYLGETTNNVAEYQGLISALTWCVEHGATRVDIRSDSLLMVQQMRGVYKVKNEGLKPLYGQARLLANKIGKVDFKHIPREENKDADRLANAAMDEAAKT